MGDKKTVLVVEDEHLVRMAVVFQLEDEGFEVLDASNAADALEILAVTPRIRLIFTDVDLPGGMDGLKLAATVHVRWPPVRIIVTSGHRLVDIADMPAGSVFFSKPYAHQDVLRSIQELVAA